MSFAKFTFTLLFACLLSFSAFAQRAANATQQEAARTQTQLYNDQLVAADPAAALTEDQQTAVQELHLKRILALAEMRRAGQTDADIKTRNRELHQENMAYAYQNILTDTQRAALKDGRQPTAVPESPANTAPVSKEMAAKVAAATDAQKARARAQTEQYNDKIKSANPEAGLTEAQMAQVDALNLQRVIKADEAREQGADRQGIIAAVSDLHRANMAYVYQNILTETQREALKAANGR